MATDFAGFDTTDSPTGPEKPRVYALKVLDDKEILRNNGFGITPTKVAAYLHAYEAAGRIHFKITRNDSPTFTQVESLAGEYFLLETLDCNKQALKQPKFNAVATGSLLALAAGNGGVIEEDSTLKLTAKGGEVGAQRHYYSQWDLDGRSYRRIPMSFYSAETPSIVNDVSQILMDDLAKKVTLISDLPVPFRYSGGDCFLDVEMVLVGVESAGDEIDLQADYEVIGITEAFGGTETNKVNETQTLGSGTAVESRHRVLIKLPAADGDNPIEIDDQIRAELTRIDEATVTSGVRFVSGSLLVPCFGGVDENI